jgi:DNA-binding FrmR family transcriptional regulator
VRTVERSLIENRDCTDVLMLLAAVKGGINALMAEILGRPYPAAPGGQGAEAMTPELAEDLIDLVRTYLK